MPLDAPAAKLPPRIDPMLAKLADALPAGDFLYEPKWDGFRALVFRTGPDVAIQSRDGRPLDRYFPDLHEALSARLPPRCVVDGEIVIATEHGLDFDALQLRLHPAATRVAALARATPASFVLFDVLALDGRNVMHLPQGERRALLEQHFSQAQAPLHLTPMTRDLALARQWLAQFEGAGLDGVIAKPASQPYQPGRRALVKVKHVRTADCVVAGLRRYQRGRGEQGVASLLLGLYDEHDVLQHVGVASSFSQAMRMQLARELAPLRADALADHPWRDWANEANAGTHPEQRMPGGLSRWSAGKDLSWEPVRIERVCEVKYDHMQGRRFRHATFFLRWRSDKQPADCRFDQLEVTRPYELERVFAQARSAARSST